MTDITLQATATPSMRQSIVTRYYGPTHTKGSRIIARAEAGWTAVPYNHALNSSDNHADAVRKLAHRFGWGGDWIGGALPNSNAYVWVDVRGVVTPAPATEPDFAQLLVERTKGVSR